MGKVTTALCFVGMMVAGGGWYHCYRGNQAIGQQAARIAEQNTAVIPLVQKSTNVAALAQKSLAAEPACERMYRGVTFLEEHGYEERVLRVTAEAAESCLAARQAFYLELGNVIDANIALGQAIVAQQGDVENLVNRVEETKAQYERLRGQIEHYGKRSIDVLRRGLDSLDSYLSQEPSSNQ